MIRRLLIALTVAAPVVGVFAFAGYGNSAAAGYHPNINPHRFSSHITNRYYPLVPGNTWVYDGIKDGANEHVVVKVLRTTRTILGVPCVVISDIVTSNFSLAEKTTDWYSQDAAGNVWYFGEASAEYKNGVVTSTLGSWEAGVDNALPGIVMHAVPMRGHPYRQEYRPGIAEDMAQVVQVGATARAGSTTYHNLVVTRDTDPLNPDKIEFKKYAPGVGIVWADRKWTGHHERIHLVKFTHS